MCGIYGEVGASREHPVGHWGEAAVDAISHRGPDERGIWREGDVFLGMRRLSIIDLAGGNQPIWNEDNTKCIVYNGELYNFLDLRPELEAKGHRFRTRSDTEVILHAYEQWGTKCLERFNGMFAFAIWDRAKRKLFVARDRIGEKPLYYFWDGTRFVFASEIKSILADPSIPRRINERGLANFLAVGHAVAPETMFRNIFKLLPGHSLTFHDGQLRIDEYWTIGNEPQLLSSQGYNEVDYSEAVATLLDDSVKRRMIADVPVGAFLSGGVDSSAVVSLMTKHASDKVKSFSLGFDVGGAYNELSDARRVAAYLGTDHYELNVEHLDLIETLRSLVYHYDEPFGDSAGFPIYLLSRFARQHVKVVLSGDGGDELFGGYRRYAIDQLAPVYRFFPTVAREKWVPSAVGRLPRLRRMKRAAETLHIQDPTSRYASWLVVFTAEMQAELLQPSLTSSLIGHNPAAIYPRYYSELDGGTEADHLNRLMYVDVKTLLADAYMEKLDKAMMACSLEGRLPMLDHRLVELAFQIPSRYKIRGWTTKRILKRAVSDLIPRHVLRRPKHGFSVPTDPWFRGSLKSFAFDVLLDDSARRRGYFQPDFVERLWKEHSEGRHVWDEQLWLLLNFEMWHRTYMDKQAV
jgi:asparagine synthase (glutamine-hydrolysing)